MFKSGSDSLEDKFVDPVNRVAEALKDEKGPVIVAGYSDNIPLSGRGRFKDNAALSLARAQTVPKMIKAALGQARAGHRRGPWREGADRRQRHRRGPGQEPAHRDRAGEAGGELMFTLKKILRWFASGWFLIPFITLVLSICFWIFGPWIGNDAFRPFDATLPRVIVIVIFWLFALLALLIMHMVRVAARPVAGRRRGRSDRLERRSRPTRR